eukprot:TRINITY_DN5579_c0_g1_i2.p1 TRINITY_DN5579_c0_g1~~TRINITY_DN5579_c0_g1_i2.p1  ORF type:complete len:374 (-),score=47.75 TRINITY_DN5579_c0_g1_i2:17-1138(-)
MDDLLKLLYGKGDSEVAKCGLEIHEQVTNIVKELKDRHKAASARLKPLTKSLCLELPFDEFRFAAIASLLNHPELIQAKRKIQSLPTFLFSSVAFVEKLAYLHQTITSTLFSDEIVVAAAEQVICNQQDFRANVAKIVQELQEVTDEIQAKCLHSKIVSKAGMVGGAVASTAGILALVTGIVLAPFTGGISIGLGGAIAMMGAGVTSYAAGGVAFLFGMHAYFKQVSLREALRRLREFENQAALIIAEFNKVNEDICPELIHLLVQQSGLTCPICFDLVKEDCRIVDYDDDKDAHEVYCADCIQKVMALSDHPVSPITRKPLKEAMLKKERSLIQRVKALNHHLKDKTGVLFRFQEACKVKASLHGQKPSDSQ